MGRETAGSAEASSRWFVLAPLALNELQVRWVMPDGTVKVEQLPETWDVPGAAISTIEQRKSGADPDRRLMVEVSAERGEEWALAVVDTVAALLHLTSLPMWASMVGLELRAEWAKRGWFDLDEWPLPLELQHDGQLLREFADPGAETLGRVLAHVPAVLDSHEASAEGSGQLWALTFLTYSRVEHAFVGDEETWALGDARDYAPVSLRERASVEQAYHNAYKAVEALLGGGLPGDERKLRSRLRDAGIDPDEPFQLRGCDLEPVETVLARLTTTRDRRAAHGGRTAGGPRRITVFELLEAQTLAHQLISEAVMSSRSS